MIVPATNIRCTNSIALRNLHCLLIALCLIGVSAQAQAFERDTHYLLTFGLALATCFDWGEAHLIASANQMIDENKSTVGEMSPLRTRNKRTWHAFGHSERKFVRLWFRAAKEKHPEHRLVKLGQFLHFLQDWEAHADYPVALGHAFATITGKDPDSLAKNQIRTSRMLQSTLVHLGKMCVVMGRLSDGNQEPDTGLLKMLEGTREVGLMKEMILISNPAWRKPRGKLSKKGRRILAENKLRIERVIDRGYRPLAEKKVPADFQPGDELHGIPPPLRLHFDREGTLSESLDRVIALAQDMESKDIDPADGELRLGKVERVQAGWRVSVSFGNNGDTMSQAGELRIVVNDALTEELLGELLFQVPKLFPGQPYKLELMVPTQRTAKEEIISIILDIDDLSMLNNHLWYMSTEDVEELREDYKQQGRSADGEMLDAPVESVEIVDLPKLWLYENKWLLSVITVRTNLNDPTDELSPPTVKLLDENKILPHDPTEIKQVWSISVLGEGQRPAAKSTHDVNVVEICNNAILENSNPVLEYTVSAGRESASTTVTLNSALTRKLRTICH